MKPLVRLLSISCANFGLVSWPSPEHGESVLHRGMHREVQGLGVISATDRALPVP